MFLPFIACEEESSVTGDFTLVKAESDSVELLFDETTAGVAADRPVRLTFSKDVDPATIEQGVYLLEEGNERSIVFNQSRSNTITVFPVGALEPDAIYELVLTPELQSTNGLSLTTVTILFRTMPADLELLSFTIGDSEVGTDNTILDVPVTPELTFSFSADVSLSSFENAFRISPNPGITISQPLANEVVVEVDRSMQHLSKYSLTITDELSNEAGAPFSGLDKTLYTQVDSTLKFPRISEQELLTKVQEQTFKYFWDFGHPVSGLARERNTSGETVTIGGSGFGVMSIIVGIERGFITREAGIERLETIINFLDLKAERFHGIWSHWLNGTTGEVIPFSADDDGADLVESAFMFQALLTVRQYLDAGNPREKTMIDTINRMWRAAEWDWFTQGGQNVLYWHWSPNFGWEKDLPIRGWNEGLIIYVLAAASPTHSIEEEVYQQGWARNGGMKNNAGNTYYGQQLPLRSDMGGPLFFAHYSFLGLDPRQLEDQYANYMEQNRKHTLLNRAYCIANPNKYVLYNEKCWGLTASDGNTGYSAHSPDNDRGVITPTAAISSIPYTPNESIEAMEFFYYIMGDKLWGPYGFYDAFNPTAGWYADSYIAIDQGPIICMIENHRSGLLWDLFMSAPEVKNGLQKLGFTY